GGGSACSRELSAQALARIADEPMPGGDTEIPEVSIAHPPKVLLYGFHGAAPAVRTADFGPQHVRFLRIPRWDMHAIGHMADRHFSLRPASEKRLEHLATHFAVQTTDTIDRRAGADSQIGHIEGFIHLVGIEPPQGQQIIE